MSEMAGKIRNKKRKKTSEEKKYIANEAQKIESKFKIQLRITNLQL